MNMKHVHRNQQKLRLMKIIYVEGKFYGVISMDIMLKIVALEIR